MKKQHVFHLAFSAMAFFSVTAQGASILHYWDFDTLDSGAPVDLGSAVSTTAVGSPVLNSSTYGEAYSGAGNALILTDSNTGYYHAGTILSVGTSDFALSYWVYSPDSSTSYKIFDTLSGVSTGMQLGRNTFRIDDDSDNSVVTNNFDLATEGQWSHFAVNVDRANDELELYVDGNLQSFASEDFLDISSLTGSISGTQNMQIGAINNLTETFGLEDLAVYSGTLTSGQIAGLANGSITPLAVPEPSSTMLGGFALTLLSLRRRRS